MRNSDLIKEFCMYGLEKGQGSNLYIEDNVLFSYGSHFPLCVRLKEGFIFNSDSYSMSTQTQKNEVIRTLTSCYNEKEFLIKKKSGEYNNIILMDTDKIKSFMFENGHNLNNLTYEDLIKLKIIEGIK